MSLPEAETPLGGRTAAIIRREGPISVERFMHIALQDPGHGYYRSGNPIGAAGDFVTAPEISQMFGELLAMWMADIWLRAGRPDSLRLVELGPGRGTLMQDMLRAAQAVAGFRDALRPVLVESSRRLAALQAERLSGEGVAWAASVAGLPAGPAFLVANEFFDALPARQFQRVAGGWRERRIAIDSGGRLAWSLGDLTARPAALFPAADSVPVGGIAEVSEEGIAIQRQIARHVREHGGAGLIVDYGYTEPELLSAGGGDTLQAVRGHKAVDPLASPGRADLSAHVNFTALARAARAEGAGVAMPVSQGNFLQALGIRERAAALRRGKPSAAAGNIDAAMRRLVDKAEMGALFRAMAFWAPGWPVPAGFLRGNAT